MDTIAEFSDNAGLTCLLTKDRFYVSSLGNEEIFALRGVNGIGIYDDVENYNKELTLFKKQDEKNSRNKLLCIGLGILFLGLGISKGDTAMIVIGIIIIIIGFNISNKLSEPVLNTYLRVMLSGGDRKFLFDKSDENSVSIAQFIFKLEQTLTAYN